MTDTISDSLTALGFSLTSIYIRPHEVPKKWREHQLKFHVTLMYRGNVVITTDYHMGIGHLIGFRSHTRITLEVEIALINAIFQKPTNAMLNRIRYTLPVPNIADVLHCLLGDATALNYVSFEEWAADFGYDSDSRKAEEIYNACVEIGLKVTNRIPLDVRNQAEQILANH